MQTTFYKTALTLDHEHSILIDNPVELCHVFFGGFIVALACVCSGPKPESYPRTYPNPRITPAPTR